MKWGWKNFPMRSRERVVARMCEITVRIISVRLYIIIPSSSSTKHYVSFVSYIGGELQFEKKREHVL